MASVHAEVPDNSDIIKIHDVIDRTENLIEEETGVHIVIHMDPIVTNCEKTNAIKGYVSLCVCDIDSSLSIHDFRISEGEEKTNLIFDLCVPVNYTGERKKEILRDLNKKIKERDEKYNLVIKVDDSY
jgi:divalent metal cation (Fe/Co/Zn/Cd) transporter